MSANRHANPACVAGRSDGFAVYAAGSGVAAAVNVGDSSESSGF
jgi:hypothetical protein